MGLLELLNQSKEAAPKRRSDSNEPRLAIIDMSRKAYKKQDGTEVPSNQGTIKFLPVVSLKGVDVKYAYDVKYYSYEGDEYSTKYRTMDPKDYEMELSDDDKAAIQECRSLQDYAIENWGFPYAENKNYALMFGYVLEHVSTEGDEIVGKDNRKAALLIFPSKNFAKAITNCLTKMQSYGDEIAEEMYQDLFSRRAERENYLTVTFSKSSGFGYDVEISADAFDKKCVKILTPEELKATKVTIPDDQMDFFTSQSAVFFAGNRTKVSELEDGVESPNDFDIEFCKEVSKQIQDYIDQEEEEKKKSEELPKIPSKNKKQKSDLDSEGE